MVCLRRRSHRAVTPLRPADGPASASALPRLSRSPPAVTRPSGRAQKDIATTGCADKVFLPNCQLPVTSVQLLAPVSFAPSGITMLLIRYCIRSLTGPWRSLDNTASGQD